MVPPCTKSVALFYAKSQQSLSTIKLSELKTNHPQNEGFYKPHLITYPVSAPSSVIQLSTGRRMERGIFPNTVHHYGLWSGFPYYGLMTPACRMPGVPHSTTWGTQPSCSVDRAPCPLARVMSAC